MNYLNISNDIKNKMYDIHLKETYDSEFQEKFRYFIGRDFWLDQNQNKLEYYYKKVNILMRKEKILELKKKI